MQESEGNQIYDFFNLLDQSWSSQFRREQKAYLQYPFSTLSLENDSSIENLRNPTQDFPLNPPESEGQSLDVPNLTFIPKDKAKIIAYVAPKRSQKGNKNLHKFLIKLFFKYIFEFIDVQDKEYIKYMLTLRKQVYSVDRRKQNMKELLKIVTCSSVEEEQFVGKNRRIFSQILSSQSVMDNEIFHSNFIKKKADKKQQLLATKIYKLRCRNPSLIKRMQTK